MNKKNHSAFAKFGLAYVSLILIHCKCKINKSHAIIHVNLEVVIIKVKRC